MGSYFSYKLKFAQENEHSLPDTLVEKGFAIRKIYRGEPTISIPFENFQETNAFFEEMKNDGYSEMMLDEKDGVLQYFRKWAPLDEVVTEIAKATNQIISVERMFDANCGYLAWCEGPNGFVTKDGKPVLGQLDRVNPKLIKEQLHRFQISVPIGTENDKWGTFYVPKENIAHLTYFDETLGKDVPYYSFVFLHEPNILVSFRESQVQMNVHEVEEKYILAKENFATDKKLPIILEVPSTDVTLKQSNMGLEDYFIVKLPCPSTFSNNKECSITVPDYSIKQIENGNYLMDIGPKGKERSIMRFKLETGIEKTTLTNGAIHQLFQTALQENPELFQHNPDVRNQSNCCRYQTLLYGAEEPTNIMNPFDENFDEDEEETRSFEF